jgi:hypothetical protein
MHLLRRLVKANELFDRYYRPHNIRLFYPGHIAYPMQQNIWTLEHKPKPLSRNNTEKLKFLQFRARLHELIARNRNPGRKNLRQELNKAQRNVNRTYGRGINGRTAGQLIAIGEARAARTIAKALRSNKVVNLAQRKRKARNFIREELSLYRRPNSTVRPSNVKARRISVL